MTQTFKMREIGNTTFKAMESAALLYREMTGGDAIRATEYFFTVAVGCAIHKKLIKKPNFGGFLGFERNTKAVLNEARATTVGKKSKDKRIENGNCDIVLYYEKKLPRAVIEVKGNLYKGAQAKADIVRIAEMLISNIAKNSLQTGVFAFVTTKKEPDAATTLDNRLKDYEAEIKSLLSKPRYAKYLHFSFRSAKMKPFGKAQVRVGVVEIWCKAPRFHKS